MEHQIRFPHLGIVLKNVGDGINIGGFEIKYYGMIIATGFLLGLIVSYYAAKHENKFDPELVFDYLITMIIPAIVGARLCGSGNYFLGFRCEDLLRGIQLGLL